MASSPRRRFDGDAPLTHGRHERLRRQPLSDAVGDPEHLERGDGHHDRPAIRHLGQAGGDVAAELDEHEVRPRRRELGPPPHRSRGDRGTFGEVGERRADQRVGGVAPRHERADQQRRRRSPTAGPSPSARQRRPSLEHGLLDLLHEHALTADRVQRYVLATVAGRVDEHQLDDEAGATCRSASATASAWVLACALPRVARRSGRSHGVVSRGRTGRARWRRCARPWACRRRL